MLGIQNQGFLDQVPTFGLSLSWLEGRYLSIDPVTGTATTKDCCRCTRALFYPY